MTTKKAALVAVGLVAAAFLFAFVYQNNMGEGDMTSSSESSNMVMTGKKPAPVTPDTATDDIIDEAVADREALDTEEESEISDLESGNESVNDLSTVYDENELQ